MSIKMKRWYVIDESENLTSYSAKKEVAEFFLTKRAARQRAVHLANTEPGKLFFIAETVEFAESEVSTATYQSV